MKKNIIPTTAMLVLLAACTWVEPTLQGSQIKLVDKNDTSLESCTKIETVTAMVKHRVGFFARSEDKVNTELITIAQNEAAEIGGDTISAAGPASNGERSFIVYDCRR